MNKEEIEKAKDVLNNYKFLFSKNIKENTDTYICNYYTKIFKDNIEILLQYINLLEQENIKQNKIIDEMSKEMNRAYFDENNFCLWFEKYITKEKSSCLSDRIKIIKQYFEKKVEEN